MDDSFWTAIETIASSWAPPPETDHDVVTPAQPARFAALLDQPNPVQRQGDPLPALWHWFLFLPTHPQKDLGADGHPRTGRHMPPLQHRRRMFGGGRVEVTAPLRCGDEVQRRSDVVSVRARRGRSGPLLLVTERHTLAVDGADRITEEQDIVYLPPRPEPAPTTAREPRRSAATAEARDESADWGFTVIPDTVMLFRFSALTANAHRIHYDLPYARDIEGHDGIVVHGPLSALLLLELARRNAPDRTVERIEWRARQPLYAGEPIHVTGSRTTDGQLAMTAGTAPHPSAVTATVRVT